MVGLDDLEGLCVKKGFSQIVLATASIAPAARVPFVVVIVPCYSVYVYPHS